MAIAEAHTKAVDAAKGKAIVLFDGQCPLCQRSVRNLKRLDWLKKFHFQDCRDIANLPKAAVPLDLRQLPGADASAHSQPQRTSPAFMPSAGWHGGFR